ncbi:MAG: ABC transporter ATP-binding protein [Desulfurococcales archaeon]|nr:ABC transporter ATP-binding protein [Desulfurococcales archaeon]
MVTVKLQGVTKRFGKVVAVDDVTLEIRHGEFFTFLGPSGCGKTTTLRVIAGLEMADEGRIFFDDTEVTDFPPYKRDTGMVFQNYALWPHMTVFDNIAYGLKLKKLPKDEIRRKVKEVLDLIKLTGMEDRYPTQLSGGQQQRVALARALVVEPKVLLLDEPLSNLDAKLRVEMREEIQRIQRKLGITAIYVTHDQEEAMVISDRIAVLNQGKVMQVGTPQELYRRPRNLFVATFLGRYTLVEGIAEGGAEEGFVKVRAGELRLEGVLTSGDVKVKEGDKVVAIIRPHAFKFFQPRKRHVTLKGVIEWASYLGPYYEARLKAGGTSFLMTVDPSVDVKVGEEMTVYVEPGDIVVFPYEALREESYMSELR